jgi:macrodomain Ter protein organizer (MatP/YcbG family)
VENPSNTEAIEGKVDVEIELSLEDWGRIALIAHRHNITINDTVEMVIREVVEREKALEEASNAEGS